MASLLPGYNYDIFISYRQKDNKGDRWVSRFVESLKTELDAIFKEDISVYFDENPHERLQETHNVDKSLEGKLNCLIFIPILSQTYCDTQSYAWKNEFLPFLRIAESDRFGKDVKLIGGNVASRILPVRINDMDSEDIKLFENETRGVLRPLDFIFKTATGVVRPLQSNEDHPNENLNKTFYRDQICKTARAIKDIILAMKFEPDHVVKISAQLRESKNKEIDRPLSVTNNKRIKFLSLSAIALIALLSIIAGILLFPKFFDVGKMKEFRSNENKISITVMPFQNMTPDTLLNFWQEGIQSLIISSLSNSGDISVYPFQTMMEILESKKNLNPHYLNTNFREDLAKKLKSVFFVNGSIMQDGKRIRVSAQLQNTKTEKIDRVFEAEGDAESGLFEVSQSLSKLIRDYLEVKELGKEATIDMIVNSTTTSPESYRNYIEGCKFYSILNMDMAIPLFKKSIELDSSFMSAYYNISLSLWHIENNKEANLYLDKAMSNNTEMSTYERLMFEHMKVLMQKNLNRALVIEEQLANLEPNIGWWKCCIGNEYHNLRQYDKSVEAYEKAHKFYMNLGLNIPLASFYAIYGTSLHKTNKHRKEKNIYKEALKIYPNYPTIISQQAVCALSMRKTSEAQKYLEALKQIRIKQNLPEENISIEQALIYARSGDLEKAKSMFEASILPRDNNFSILKQYANFLIQYNIDLNKGMELVDDALNREPGNVNLLYSKGIGLYKLGKFSESLNNLKKSWDLRTRYHHEHYLYIKDAENALANSN